MSTQFPAVIELSSLDGRNGFQLNGVAANDYSGYSVSVAGDINNDGVADLIIGASRASSSGQSYVVFGATDIGNGGVFELSNLDGSNGFTLNGIATGDKSGTSVSAAGDINDDGVADLIIGAYAANPNGLDSGQSYVVFGASDIGTGGTLDLSSLDGSNGFALNGIAANDFSGRSVSAAGDINNDGVADLIIGAYSANPNDSDSGQSYVVFGAVGIGSAGVFELSSLNGSNGFKLNGIEQGDLSGWSVSAAGDINNDGVADLIIGAYKALGGSGPGQSYVIFGATGIGGGGTFELSALNGANGFTLNGIVAQDDTGYSVAAAADVNHDGVVDLIIGAPSADPNGSLSGQTYTVFGAVGVGSGGTFQLSGLNGINGFALKGAVAGDYSGLSVNAAGDINDDGVADLIVGAAYADPNGSNSGQTYVVFGATDIGNGGGIELSSLNGRNGFTLNGIAAGDRSGFSVSTAGDINNDGVADLIIGAPFADPNGSDSGQSYVVFGDHLAIVKNQVTVTKGQTETLSLSNLNATSTYINHNNTLLQFQMSAIQAGYFQLTTNVGVPITSFSQQSIIGTEVEFVHNGSDNSPSYNVSANDGFAVTSSEAATIHFNYPPVFISNSLTINQGQTIVLSSNDISATDPDSADPNLIFIVSDLQHGQFEATANSGVALPNFTQQQVDDNELQFVQDGSSNAPVYSLSISDGFFTTTPQAANITFNIVNAPPVIGHNQLTINQGETVLFSSAQLSATDADNSDAGLQLIFSDVEHGRFELTSMPGVSITQLIQQQIYSGHLQFVHDGSWNAPSYQVTVTDSSKQDGPEAAMITFNSKPMLEENNLSVRRADTVIITFKNLKASDNQTPDGDLIFLVSALKYGQFELINKPGIGVDQFLQRDVDLINVQFVHDASKNPPRYNITVSDGTLSSPSSKAAIKWDPDIRSTVIPRESDNTARNILIGTFLSVGAIGSLLLCYMSMGFLKNHRLKAVGERDNEEQAHFYNAVIIPIARAVFKQIKVTGFMNYISMSEMEAYVAEIATVVNEINQLGIHVELQDMDADHQTRLLNEIVKQMKRHLGIQSGMCNRAWFTGIFKPQVTPEMIGQKAKRIANSVHAALMGNVDDDIDEVELSTMGGLEGVGLWKSMDGQDVVPGESAEIDRLRRLLKERDSEIVRLRTLSLQQNAGGDFSSTTSYVKFD